MPHEVALSGFSTDAERYESGRPGYPADAVQFILETIDPDGDDVVIDVGAGTGKLTRELTASPAQVVALDPVAEMLALIPARAPTAHLVLGSAENIPVGDGVASALTVAQAFHWFDPGRAWDEFARVLRPNGAVVLVWNARLRDQDWVDQIWSLMDEVEKRAPWRNHDKPEMDETHEMFSDLERTVFDHSVEMTDETVLGRVLSVSHVAVLPDARRAAIADEVRQIIASADRPLVMNYRTDVFVRRRL